MTNPIPGADSERTHAEQEYMRLAFDYAQQPIGSRDWCLFWDGYRTARAAAKVGANVAADELHFNAQRLRNVAELVGVNLSTVNDETVDGARGALLGEIAAKLRAAGAPAETPKESFHEKLAREIRDGTAVFEKRASGAPAEMPQPDLDFNRVMTLRDAYHDIADKLAEAIAEHLGIDIGEHSSDNKPWLNALEAIAAQPIPAPIAGDVETDAAEVIVLTEAELSFVERVKANPGSKLSGFAHDSDCNPLWVNPERAGLIVAVGSYKWRPTAAAMLANSSSGEAG